MVKGLKSAQQKSGTQRECSDGELQVSQVKNGQKPCVLWQEGRGWEGQGGSSSHVSLNVLIP